MKTTFLYTATLLLFLFYGCVKENEHIQDEHTQQGEHTHEQVNGASYTCPMHPQIVQHEPGTCPICRMDLVPVSKGNTSSPEIMLSKSQILLGNITTDPVRVSKTSQATIALGRLTENKESVEVISSRAAGRIEKLYVKQTGERISKGQPLYELYSEQILTYTREYLLAKAQYDSLPDMKNTYRRFYESARRKLLLYGLSEGQVRNLEKTKQPSPSITFLSPTEGYVTEVVATEGGYIAEGSPLYRTVNLTKLWVEADLYEGETGLVKAGDRVDVRIAGFERQPVEGKVTFISPEYRNNSRVFTFRIEIDNAQGQFAPGMQAQALINRSGNKAIMLPTDALIQDAKGAHVWVKSGEGTFMPRMVKTGLENPDSIEITSGLNDQDTVVVSGAYLLYSEYILKKGGNPMAGHDHSTM